MAVSVPVGYLLVQAGKQLEFLTGGQVLAGFHEVAVTEATVDAIQHRRQRGESLWRVSSTVFGAVASDQVLRPIGKFATGDPEVLERYPPTTAGDQVQEELRAIALGT